MTVDQLITLLESQDQTAIVKLRTPSNDNSVPLESVATSPFLDGVVILEANGIS